MLPARASPRALDLSPYLIGETPQPALKHAGLWRVLNCTAFEISTIDEIQKPERFTGYPFTGKAAQISLSKHSLKVTASVASWAHQVPSGQFV